MLISINVIFFSILGLVFFFKKKEKKRASFILMFSSTKLLFKMKLELVHKMISMLKANQTFSNVFFRMFL